MQYSGESRDWPGHKKLFKPKSVIRLAGAFPMAEMRYAFG